jgi:hypothetical protein
LRYRVQRALTLAALNDHARAAAQVEEVAAHKDLPMEISYPSASAYALCVSVIDKDAQLKTGERQQLSELYGSRAVALLRRAVLAGFKDVEQMKKDTDLDPLRTRDDFRLLISELEEKAKKQADRKSSTSPADPSQD